MDFRLMGLAHSAFFEETGEWGGGLRNIYEHMTTDYVYPDIYNVLRFLDNHDTDRFLPEMPKNLDSFKQGITFLLTIPGIPQIYYGTELLMNGNKSKSDGDIRKDVPGGWPDDSVNQFTAEGRSELQNEAFNFMQKLLKWRQGNEILAKGKMKHYVPQNGVYVYERYLNDKSIVVFMNGTSKEASIDLGRYTESIKNRKTANDIISGQQIQFADKLVMSPRQIMIFEI